jgi:hypothetical protein
MARYGHSMAELSGADMEFVRRRRFWHHEKAGYLGIGTTSPTSPLTVQIGASTQWINAVRIENPSTTASTYIGFTNNGSITSTIRSDFGGNLILTPFKSGSVWYGLDNANTQNHFFYTTGALRMAIVASGNVGIGTTTPASTLDVAGNLTVSGSGHALVFPDGTQQTTAGPTGVFGSNNINFFTNGGSGASCTLGSILLNASVLYSENYLPADGRLLSISTNTALFSLLGTNYGGNGTSTFALPDLRKAAPNNTQYLICVSGVFP